MLRILLLIKMALLTFSANASAQTQPEMIQVPAGCADVGSLLMDQQSNPLRQVCLDNFMIGKYEVTFQEYDVFAEETGRPAPHDINFGRDDRPVVDVTWFDAVAYAQWLSVRTGKKYRLPSDAEWEYAAKFGTEFGFNYSWGVEIGLDRANCMGCSSQSEARMTMPVGSFGANSLGLFDMHGNVWEWSSDCYYSDSPKVVNDMHCEVGVVRGGSWDAASDKLVFWLRAPQMSTRPAQDIGFRLVLEP